MDWNANLRPCVHQPDQGPFSFLYNYNYDPFPGMEVQHPAEMMAAVQMGGCFGSEEKKKRLTSDQIESLENSFQEEIKLDPDRKMKLARELGLQPRQVAVWFQNRRARWKAKQLERLYDALKQEFDAVSTEKQKLEEEVVKLKAMLMDEATRKQGSTGHTEISGDETAESTSAAAMGCCMKGEGTSPQQQQGGAECHYLFNVDEYSTLSPPYWSAIPPYP
ncbi:hypothetical protein Nepgr_025023 [Nepenthes gracilis]|uniref:Homeobox-leucine zipper protein n=1 Tax=Nepenthes gracilis TaxID=150966 RepID=A0AAD3T4B1_NEPGR|nr:hypothetical protein Nepgr_025023 [Nepenthes gracilis]